MAARSQTNSIYDYPISAVSQTYTRNGLNQYPQITGTGGGTLAWDANGNLTSDGSTTYTYDTENRLTAAKGATLTYDPMGRLYQVSNASGTTRFLYDGDRLILEYDAYGVTTAPSTWRFQYTGQTAIQQVGLYYYKARFYNPSPATTY